MSKRFKQINEKDIDEFYEAEENQDAKRKTELDHSYIASEAALHVNRPPTMEELSPSELDTQKREPKTFVEYRFYCKYSFYIVIKWHFLLNF